MKRSTIAIIFCLIIFLGGYLWWNNGISPVNTANHKMSIFVIKKGESTRDIATSLKNKGFIKDPVVFFLLLKKLGLDSKIEAGDFRLSPSMSAQEIAQTLTHGTLDIWITIPEGKRALEIAEILKNSLPSYKKSWNAVLEQNEGYLFPDTYLIPKDASINLIVSLMRENFTKKFNSIKNLKTTNLTTNQTVILASIIEREAKFAKDRPLVASVLINRLNAGMALGVDATIQYALGYQPDLKTWWKPNLTKEDLGINSPYNSYINPGLPPTPISNPGIYALEAALHPANTDYFYYISDKYGNLHFSKTLQGQNANIIKYGL